MEDSKGCEYSRGPKSCRIDKKLLPIKAFYFTFLAGVGSLFPFVSIYMKQLGLTSSETGIIYGVMPFVCFFVRPLVGAIADRWRKHKAVLIVCTLLTALLHLLIMLVPSRVPPLDMRIVGAEITCGLDRSWITSCGETEVVGGPSDCSMSLPQFVTHITGVEDGTQDSNATTSRKLEPHEDASAFVQCTLRCRLNHEQTPDCKNHHCDVCLTNISDSARFCDDTLVQLSEQSIILHTLGLTLRKPHRARWTPRPDGGEHSDHYTEPTSKTWVSEECTDYWFEQLKYRETQFRTMTCVRKQTLSCEMTCKNLPGSELCSLDHASVDLTFWLLFLLFFLASAAFSPIFSLADAAIFELLGDQHQKYGQQRMWGTLGLAIFAITCTFVMNVMRNVNRVINYVVMFYFFAGLCALSVVFVSFMKISPAAKSNSMIKNACRLLIVPEVSVFLLVVIYLGMMSGAVEGFLFWYLTDLGAGPLVFGLCLVVNCAFEIPFFFFSGTIINRVGRMKCLYSAMLVLSVRLLAYSLLANAWHVLLVETLHGVTFAVMWAAVTTHANSIAPPGMSASTQGLVGGMNFGIGKGLGSLLTGFLFDRVGARWTFRVYAIACVLLLAAYAAFNICMDRKRRKNKEHNNHQKDLKEAGQTSPQQQPFLQSASETDEPPVATANSTDQNSPKVTDLSDRCTNV